MDSMSHLVVQLVGNDGDGGLGLAQRVLHKAVRQRRAAAHVQPLHQVPRVVRVLQRSDWWSIHVCYVAWCSAGMKRIARYRRGLAGICSPCITWSLLSGQCARSPRASRLLSLRLVVTFTRTHSHFHVCFARG